LKIKRKRNIKGTGKGNEKKTAGKRAEVKRYDHRKQETEQGKHGKPQKKGTTRTKAGKRREH